MSKQTDYETSTEVKLQAALNENVILRSECERNEDYIRQLQSTLKMNVKVIESNLKTALNVLVLEETVKLANNHIDDLYWLNEVTVFHSRYCPKSTKFFCAADEARKTLDDITTRVNEGRLLWMKVNCQEKINN